MSPMTAAFLALVLFSNAPAAEDVIVLSGCRILSVRAGELEVIPRGTVVIRDGRIAAVGEDIAPPPGARTIDVSGRWLLPGFIDAHSQLGVRGESDEIASAVTEDLRLIDAFDPWDVEIERALSRGVTAAALSPGDRNVVGGAVTVLKLVPERVPALVVRSGACMKASVARAVLGGPSFPRYPTALSGAMELFGSWLAGNGRSPSRAMSPVLVRVENRSQADRALALLDAAGRPGILLGGRSLDANAYELLQSRVPVVVGPYQLGDPRRLTGGAAALEALGVPIAFSGEDGRRDVLTSAVLAMRAGLSRAAALAALTDGPARLYGLESRLGRIEPGADADVVVWSGDPFTLAARVELVFIDGRETWRAKPPAPLQLVQVGPAAPPAPVRRGVQRLAALAAEPAPIVIRAARVHPIASPMLAPGMILVRGGKIAAVGERLDVPPGARLVEVEGDVFPGLIDAGSTAGIPGSAAEEYRELTPEIRAADGVDRDAAAFRRAREAGVTAIAITPGDRNVIGGLGAVLKTAHGRRAGDVLKADAFLTASLSEASTEGNLNLRSTPPYSFYHRLPNTRMGSVFLLRRACFEALGEAPGSAPAFSEAAAAGAAMARLLFPAGRRVLADALRGRLPLRVRAEERQEIEATLRIAEEFKRPLILEGFGEGLEFIARVKAGECRVILRPGLTQGGAVDRGDSRVNLRLAMLLEEAGVPFAFASLDPSPADFRDQLALTSRNGIDPAAVLKAATLGAARILGVEERLGTIEPGKDADLIAVTGGGPLALGARVRWVMIDGDLQPGPTED